MAAAATPPSQPASPGNGTQAATTDNGTKAVPAHQSAQAMKVHAMSRRRVEEIQAALNKDGAQLAIDGVYGPKTRAAIEDFQKKNDLKVTGRADQETMRKLQPQHWS
jgi:peptidoglycan hydrolase-like protein with peptidoglycan-binding domain